MASVATYTIGEHPSVPKIRTLLALAASATKIGSIGEAIAAGNAARKIAESAGLAHGYSVHYSDSEWSKSHDIHDALDGAWIGATPAKAWGHTCDHWLTGFGRPADPSIHIIVGCIATGETNARGCTVVLMDWSDVHRPASAHAIAAANLPS